MSKFKFLHPIYKKIYENINKIEAQTESKQTDKRPSINIPSNSKVLMCCH